MWPNPQFPADLVSFTEEIRNGKLHILRSVKAVDERFFDIIAVSKQQYSETHT